MANLPPKTVVAKAACACCGKPVLIKLNVNGIAYYFCQWPDEDGERCSHHQKWGRVKSQQMQDQYIAARKANKGDPADGRPVTDIQPAPQPERKPDTERDSLFP